MNELKCCQCKGVNNLHVIYTLKSGYKSYRCRECNTKNHRRYRLSEKGKKVASESSKRYREKNREKIRAHDSVHWAVKVGKLVKEKCVVCGSEKSEGHHENYDKRLEVVWLCRKCHKDLHFGKINLCTCTHSKTLVV